MFIRDMFSSNKPVISFEIFPPKKEYPLSTIFDTIEGLKNLNPDFISVTYGAGGSVSERTAEIAAIVKNKYGIESLAHLTCVSSTRDEIQDVLSNLRINNIDNILALRGDIPNDPDFKFPSPLQYEYAKDLVSHIRSNDGFSIGAAAYPEGHIDCNNKEEDFKNLKEKVDCGVDFLITQLFFDNDLFFEFKENLQKYNINIPVSAGIMPVLNANQIKKIVTLSGASLPNKFKRIIEKYENNPAALKEAGIAYATEQIIDLLSSKVDGIHLYTMNKPLIATKIIDNISEIRSALARSN